MLVDKIREAQRGNQDAMLYLIQKYMPLLSRYSKKLHQEDAYSELTLAFIELIHHIRIDRLISGSDGAITNYIAASVIGGAAFTGGIGSLKNAYNAYIKKIMVEKDRITALEDFTEQDEFQLLNTLPEKASKFDFLEFLRDFSDLTEKEKQILFLIYYENCSASEIADQMKTSRQNVNQIKVRAQSKIKSKLQI